MKTNKFIVICMIIYLLSSCWSDFGRKEKFKEKEITGKVITKYRDSWGHDAPTLKIQNNLDLNILDWARGSNLWNYIEVGDSIFKASGSLQLQVIKPNGESRKYNYN